MGGCAVDKVVDVLHKPPDQQQVLFIWNKPILQDRAHRKIKLHAEKVKVCETLCGGIRDMNTFASTCKSFTNTCKCSPLTQPQPGDCSSLRTDVSHTISDHNNSGHAGLALLFIDKDDVMTY